MKYKCSGQCVILMDMEKFNIDLFIPDYESVVLKKGVRRKQVSMYHEGMGRMLRINVDKVLNWRMLESRLNEIKVASQKLRSKFYDFVARLGRETHDDEEKWIMIDESTVVAFRGTYYSYEDAKKVINDATKSIRKMPKFFLVGIEEGGREVGRLLNLMNTYDKAQFMYEGVLKHTLRDRFMTYLRKEGVVNKRDKIFILRNEGRCLVVTVGFGGKVNFIDGDVVECLNDFEGIIVAS